MTVTLNHFGTLQHAMGFREENYVLIFIKRNVSISNGLGCPLRQLEEMKEKVFLPLNVSKEEQ